MISALGKVWKFSEGECSNISKSVVLSFFYAIFHMFQIGAIYFVVIALTRGDNSNTPALLALSMLLVSIIGRTVTKTFSQLKQVHAGYYSVANKRIDIGNKLKSVPMGFFNENSLGEISGISTTILDNVETLAPVVLVSILSGFINAIVFTLMILIFDWRIGLVVVAGTAIYLMITSSMEKKTAQIAPQKNKSEAMLVSAVLECIKGISVVKSFNLTGRGDRKVQDALEFNRKSNMAMEKLFIPYNIAQRLVLEIFAIVMMLVAVLCFLNGSMSIANTLMSIIMSFLVFAQIETAGRNMSILRLVSSSIDHVNQIDIIPQIDEGGSNMQPHFHEIEFKDVYFSYKKKEILHGISLEIPDKTTTAIIGPSGSGKTTLCSLIARFWDVDSGSIQVGGENVRDYTLESLMDQISIVFQNVYLFADTIENNIKFGKPEATHEEVISAAKKACCYDFIQSLPDGYQAVIGEGGASLSGGEKQRISIARAILKDSPIIILDEATANVDPENEDRLQKAIEELTRNKTIIMIAHRLKTVKNAHQIVVLDKGKIVQKGTHDQLMMQKGIYADFVLKKEKSFGWKLKTDAYSGKEKYIDESRNQSLYSKKNL